MDYPSNSSQRKPVEKVEEKKVVRVVEGEVIRRKRPLGKRFLDMFVVSNARGVWGYIVADVLVPAAKDMVVDAVVQSTERTFFGDSYSPHRGRGIRSDYPPHVNYNSRYSNRNTPPRRDEPRAISQRGRATHNFDEVILDTRGEAEKVIDQMYDLISRFEVVSVTDFYDIVGITPEYTDKKWGWTDIRDASVERVPQGYLINLPRPEPIQ